MERVIETPMGARRNVLPDSAGVAGATAGLLAGLLMIVLSPALSWLTGIGIWEPAKLIAVTVYGPSVTQTVGFVLGPVVTGTAIHIGTSVALGFAFGLVFHRALHLTTDFGTPLLVGLVYWLLIFVVAYAVALPAINPTLRGSIMAPFVAQNMVFGVSLGGFFTLLRPEPYVSTLE